MTIEFIFNTVFPIGRTRSPSPADGMRNSLIYKTILQQNGKYNNVERCFFIIIIQTVYTDEYKISGIYKTVL